MVTVRHLATCVLGMALSGAFGCKQSEPQKLYESAPALQAPPTRESFPMEPGQCTMTDLYKICRYIVDGKEWITAWQGSTGLFRVELPSTGTAGTSLIRYDACECRLYGCKPACSPTQPPPTPSGPTAPAPADAGPTPDASTP